MLTHFIAAYIICTHNSVWRGMLYAFADKPCFGSSPTLVLASSTVRPAARPEIHHRISERRGKHTRLGHHATNGRQQPVPARRIATQGHCQRLLLPHGNEQVAFSFDVPHRGAPHTSDPCCNGEVQACSSTSCNRGFWHGREGPQRSTRPHEASPTYVRGVPDGFIS